MGMKRRQTFEDGYRRLQRGDVAAARAVFDDLPRTDPRVGFGLMVCDHHLNPAETPAVYARRCALAEEVLAGRAGASDPLRDLAVRYAANHLAYGTLTRARGPADLERALAYARIGVAHDPDLDETTAPVTATQVEILVALDRFDEAFELCQRILERRPAYPHLSAVTGTDRYRTWTRARAAAPSPLDPVFDASGVAPTPALRRLLALACQRNRNPAPRPLARADVDALRVWRWRDRGDPTVPLPPSLRLLLAYDQDLHLDRRRLLAALFDRRDPAGAVASPTMTEVCAADGQIGAGFAPRGTMRWDDGPDMPALLELPLGGDQRVFLYLGEPDADGEYPVVRFDNQPELWMTSASLADELVEHLPGADQRLAAAAARHRRWLAREHLRR